MPSSPRIFQRIFWGNIPRIFLFLTGLYECPINIPVNTCKNFAYLRKLSTHNISNIWYWFLVKRVVLESGWWDLCGQLSSKLFWQLWIFGKFWAPNQHVQSVEVLTRAMCGDKKKWRIASYNKSFNSTSTLHANKSFTALLHYTRENVGLALILNDVSF